MVIETRALVPDIAVTWVYRHAWQAGEQLPNHTALSSALWLVHAGSLRLTTPSLAYTVRAGQICWIPSLGPWTITAQEATDWISLGVSVHGLVGLAAPPVAQMPHCWEPSPELWQMLVVWFDQALTLAFRAARYAVPVAPRRDIGVMLPQALRVADPADRLCLTGLSHAIFGACLPSLGDHNALVPAWLADMIAQMYVRPHTPVATWAEEAGYSPSQFRHLFLQYVGVPPQRFLLHSLFDQACRLLHTTEMPIGSVATQLGFASGAHFSRFFKTMAGIPPATFRAQFGSTPC